jgi:hypothetical protein
MSWWPEHGKHLSAAGWAVFIERHLPLDEKNNIPLRFPWLERSVGWLGRPLFFHI